MLAARSERGWLVCAERAAGPLPCPTATSGRPYLGARVAHFKALLCERCRDGLHRLGCCCLGRDDKHHLLGGEVLLCPL